MAKKKTKHGKKQHPFRNAAPRAPRARRASPSEETPLKRLGYTAAGAAGTALVGLVPRARGLGAEDDRHGARRGRRGSRVEGRRADDPQRRRGRDVARPAASSR